MLRYMYIMNRFFRKPFFLYAKFPVVETDCNHLLGALVPQFFIFFIGPS